MLPIISGYGHQAPTTTSGRMICLLYALIGVPLNAILIGGLGSVFSAKASSFKKIVSEDSHFKQAVAETIGFFLVFFAVFLPIPATILSFLENDNLGIRFNEGDWSFLNSLYYTFITLSTIGFGDLVPGKNKQ